MRTELVASFKLSVLLVLCTGLVPPSVSLASSPPAQRSTARRDENEFGGLPRRGFLGMTLSASSEGLVVVEIARGSSAAAAGLKAQDIITALDGTEVGDGSAVRARLRELRAGERLRLTVGRGPQAREITLTIDGPPREGDLDAVVEYSAFAGTRGALRSLWAIPKQPAQAPRPAVLIVRGVGAPPADAPGVNPFRELAFRLAREGFIAVRFDAAGVGDSRGGPSAVVDFETEVADLKAALAHVRADKRVDGARVAVVAQGTGGGAATVVAAADPELSALVVVGTIARPLMEYALESRRAQLALAGVSPGEAHELLRWNSDVFSRLVAGASLAPDEAGIIAADGSVMGKAPVYWRQYDALNWGNLYANLALPVMNAIGEYDFVSTMGDHRAIADALRARGQQEGVLFVLEGADHDLRWFESREDAFRAFESAESRPSERALARIAEWLAANVRRRTVAGTATERER